MTAVRDELRLLGAFHYLFAVFAALFSLFPALYVAMGVALLRGGEWMNGARPPPPPLAWIVIGAGIALMLAGFALAGLVAVAGRFLRTARHWAFCVVVAALSCAFFPFGTVLGVFTIIVLARDETRAVFSTGDARA